MSRSKQCDGAEVSNFRLSFKRLCGILELKDLGQDLGDFT